MALTTAQQVRLLVQDFPRLRDQVFYGDGLASSFVLPWQNITSGSAFVPVGAGGGTAWSATGATFNASGMVSFNTASFPSASAFRVTCVDSVFSDDEIGHFTAVGGDVKGAALEALNSLLFDAGKRARWYSPDGASYDDIGSITALMAARSAIKADQYVEAAGDAHFQSWAENQELY